MSGRAAAAGAPGVLLVRGVNWLGDAVMTTPALVRIREALPSTRIVLLTAEKLAGLWGGHPAVDEVLTLARGESVWSVGRRLRSRRFDAALVLPNSPRAALEVFLGRVPRRIGYARGGRGLLLTQRVPERPGVVRMRKPGAAEVRARIGGTGAARWGADLPATAHHCHEYLVLAGALGAGTGLVPPVLRVGGDEVESVRSRFGLEPGRIWLGLNPGAEYGPAKRWPAERYSAVAQAVAAALGAGVGWVVFGGPNDRSVAGAIASAVPGSVDLSGRTSLRELMAALSVCRVLLTNDTGPMHVGAALGVPVVVPFGSTSPELTGPGLPGDPRHRFVRAGVACAPCFLRECPIDFRCMTGIEAGRVAGEVLGVLGRPSGAAEVRGS